MYHIPPGPRGGGTTNRGAGAGGRGGGRGGAGGGRGGGRGGSGGNRGGAGGNRGNAFKRGGGRGGNRGGGNRGGAGKRGGAAGSAGNKSHPGGRSMSNAAPANSSSSNLFSSLCTVCNDKPAKYRCITCRAPYCSLLCNNNHKKTPCTPNAYLNATANAAGVDDDDEEQLGDKFEPKPMQSFLGALHRKIKSVPGLPSSALIEEEERNARVPLSRLMRLVHTDAILDSLSSSALRDLITSIDSAPNDAIRENRLKHALSQPQFAQFADLCLEIIRKPDLSAPADPAAAAARAPDTSLAFAMDMAPDWQKQKWGMGVVVSDDSDGDSSGDSDAEEDEASSGQGQEEMDVDAEASTSAAEGKDDVAVEDGEEEGEIVLVG